MHGGQIQTCIDSVPLLREHSGGIYPADRLPLQPRPSNRATFFIVNSHERNKSGQHWLCFLFPAASTEHPEFFDSYALLPQRYHVHWNTYLTKRTGQFRAMNRPIQDFFSDTCGAHCLLYAHTRLRGNSFETLLKEYYSATDTCSNDAVAALYVQQMCPTTPWLSPHFQVCKTMYSNIL